MDRPTPDETPPDPIWSEALASLALIGATLLLVTLISLFGRLP
jgi:hypothetical protein